MNRHITEQKQFIEDVHLHEINKVKLQIGKLMEA